MNRTQSALMTLIYFTVRLHQQTIKQKGDSVQVVAALLEFVAPLLPSDLDWRTVLQQAIGKASHPLAMRIQAAEQLAAGTAIDWNAAPVPLVSVLSLVQGDSAVPAFHLPHALALDEKVFFPTNKALNREDFSSARKAVWDGFADKVRRLDRTHTAETLVTALHYLLAEVATFVAVPGVPNTADIALFDLARLTAALVSASDEDERKAPRCLLVEGDVSGIQKFIYTITSRGATPALRGRSFYLQLLTEAAARLVLRRIGVPITNLVYASGGRFFLIVPDDGMTRAALDEIQTLLDSVLLDAHRGQLAIALGAASFNGTIEYKAAARAAGEAVSARKRRKFAGLHEQLFTVPASGGDDTLECQVCHHEGDDVTLIAREGDTPVRKCAFCASVEALGKDLRDAPHLALIDIDPIESGGRRYQDVLARLGMIALIDRDREGWNVDRDNADALWGKSTVLLGLRAMPGEDRRDRLHKRTNSLIVEGVRFTANVTPLLSNGDRATFEDIEQAASGLKRLGALTMDVDDLGTLFAAGMSEKQSLVRAAAVSAALSRYFEGWVGVLCQRINDRRRQDGNTETVYTIYSGGDDLFIVGAWDALVTLAQQIQDDFARYSSGGAFDGASAPLHISGGLALFGGKQPLYKAAEEAESALKAAKALPGKSAFTLFGTPQTWKQFAQVTEHHHQLNVILEVTDDNRAVLALLLDLLAQYQAARKEQGIDAGSSKVVWGAHMWRAAYQLHRLAQRQKTQGAESLIGALKDALQGERFTAIEQIGLAAQWTAALTRKERD